jgi:hypothetical protein
VLVGFPFGLSLEVTDRSAGQVSVLILRRTDPILPSVFVKRFGLASFSCEKE